MEFQVAFLALFCLLELRSRSQEYPNNAYVPQMLMFLCFNDLPIYTTSYIAFYTDDTNFYTESVQTSDWSQKLESYLLDLITGKFNLFHLTSQLTLVLLA